MCNEILMVNGSRFFETVLIAFVNTFSLAKLGSSFVHSSLSSRKKQTMPIGAEVKLEQKIAAN